MMKDAYRFHFHGKTAKSCKIRQETVGRPCLNRTLRLLVTLGCEPRLVQDHESERNTNMLLVVLPKPIVQLKQRFLKRLPRVTSGTCPASGFGQEPL